MSGAVLYLFQISGHHEQGFYRGELTDAKVTARNFYGTLRVFNGGEGVAARRTLMHGQIVHGRQFATPAREDLPTAYYSEESGVGRALLAKTAQFSNSPLHVGVVGVGIGTLLTYGRAGDLYRLYDIDPLVIHLARTEFTFFAHAKASTEVVIADARLALEREAAQQFDVLVVDAFSGDAVPIHLLTKEAFAEYFKHLKPDGVLAVHVTNRFLDLIPVVKAAADNFGRQARLVSFEGDSDRLIFRSNWVLIHANGDFFARPEFKDVAQAITARADFRIWDDNYSSVLAVLK